jgi:phosphoserine phosphatase RsbU/P
MMLGDNLEMIMVKFWQMCWRRPGRFISLTATLLVLAGVFAAYNRWSGRELKPDDAATHQLRMTLTGQIAERIDNDLRQFCMIPQALAAMLSLRDDWRLDQLKRWMAQMLERDERLYGTCAAFEPGESAKDDATLTPRQEHALYVSRGKNGLDASWLEVPSPKPIWYTEPRDRQEGVWTEPFLDYGGGDIFMVSCSVPIWRKHWAGWGFAEHRFAGVATADLSVAYFKDLRNRLDKLNFGTNGHCFILSSAGTFLSHKKEEYRMPKKITDIPAFNEGKALQYLTRKILNGETGTANAIDPYTGKQSTFCFAPIPSARWMLVAVFEE